MEMLAKEAQEVPKTVTPEVFTPPVYGARQPTACLMFSFVRSGKL